MLASETFKWQVMDSLLTTIDGNTLFAGAGHDTIEWTVEIFDLQVNISTDGVAKMLTGLQIGMRCG